MENVTNNQDNIKKPKSKIIKVIKYVLLVLFILYAAIVAVRVFQIKDEKREAEKVKQIHSIRLTMKDIDEANLPPAPDEAINNSTVAGVDVNQNYVRDDIERFIFEKYKTNEERAAWMQYARAESFVTTKANSKETLKEVLRESSRANDCTLDIYVDQEGMTLDKLNAMSDPIEAMILNTELRKQAQDRALEYLTTSDVSNEESCDLFN